MGKVKSGGYISSFSNRINGKKIMSANPAPPLKE